MISMCNTMKKQFGDQLKKLRLENQLTQEQLAQKLNTGKASISHYESNRRLPDLETIKFLAQLFNVSVDYLLGNSDIRNPYIDESLPDKLTTAEEAAQFLLEQKSIMAYGEFDINKLSDNEKIQFANELLQQLKLLAYKYKK